MAVDLLQTAGDLTGFSGSGGGLNIGLIILIVLLIILFGVISGVITYFIVLKKQYKLTINIFERIDGRFIFTKKDKAKKIPIGKGGDEAIMLRKHKKMLPMPTMQTGINIYWYFISDDGEWINFAPGDFDEDRLKMGAQMLDKEMRYARTSLQYMQKERYDGAPTFMQKYGGLIAYTILILITAVGLWLILGRFSEIMGATDTAIDKAGELLEQSRRILGTVDAVKGGSGISPA